MTHFFVFKYLIQPIGPIQSTFYLKSSATPFWLHPILQPDGYQMSMASGSSRGSQWQTITQTKIQGMEILMMRDDGLIVTKQWFPVEYQKFHCINTFMSTSVQCMTSEKIWNTSCNLKISRCWRHLKGTMPHSCLEDHHQQHGRGIW